MMKSTGWESDLVFFTMQNSRESGFQNQPASFFSDSGNSILLNLQPVQCAPHLHGLLHPKGSLE